MRLPGRFLAIACGFLTAAASVGQAPPPPPKPREVPGGTMVVAPPTQALEESPAVGAPAQAPQPLGFESDVNCYGYIGQARETFPASVIGAENVAEQTDFTFSDLLYIDAGYNRGFKVGDEFWIVTPEAMVVHPVTGKNIGRFYQHRGRAVVDSVEGRTATVRVTNACTDIPMGSFLKPFEPIPIPLARKTAPAVAGDPPSGKVRGRIVATKDGIVAVGADHTVLIDLGMADGVEPGDFLTIFRYAAGREYGIRPVGEYWVNLPPPPGVDVPRTYLGEIAILQVGDRWAVGRVTDSYRMIGVGDEVELK